MEPDHAQAIIHLPGEGRVIDMGAFGMTVQADASDTAGSFSLLEAAEPPGFGPPMHTHEDAGEAFYVLEGEYLIFLEDQEYRCPAGSFVFIPAGRVHGFRVGDVASRKLNIYTLLRWWGTSTIWSGPRPQRIHSTTSRWFPWPLGITCACLARCRRAIPDTRICDPERYPPDGCTRVRNPALPSTRTHANPHVRKARSYRCDGLAHA
jgi:mannose-6-phosphate isomerase-like protein (cupin superfamily)